MYKQKKYTVLTLFIILTFSKSFAQTFMANVPGRETINLNGNWPVVLDWYGKGENKKIFLDEAPKTKNDFNEYNFSEQSLSVPSDWNSQRSNLEYYEGILWYKKEFKYSPRENQRIFLHFGAVNYFAKVYLNGELLGTHEGGFTPFQFEITGKARQGTNKLIVSVDNKRIPDGIPALSFDWWNYGGITRDVNLIYTPKSYIHDYFVQLRKGTTNRIEGWLALNGNSKAEEITLAIPEAGIKKTFKTNDQGYVAFSFDADLKLWSPESPKLYDVKLSSLSDKIEEKIGFRSIEVKNEDILLNGKSVFLKGVSFHEEIAQRKGRATSLTDALQLLTWAKDLGCNFVRLAHYPQNEYILRLADEMGFMVWEEIPIWQGIDFKNPVILSKAKLMLKEMITRDKNRSSVIIWSLSNETRPSPDRNKVLIELTDLSRKMDPTRLISSAFDHFRQEGNKITITDPLSEHLDILAANKYMGWYNPWPGIPGDIVWKSDFKKPMIMSEFGAEALFGNHGTADLASSWTEEFQEKVFQDNLKMFDKIPFLRGVCPWVLADFRSPYRMYPVFQDGWNRKGLLSEKGEKKKAWYIIHDYYLNEIKNDKISLGTK